MTTVLIVAGESSGELYGSLLAKEIWKLRPSARILGMGGQRMKEAGVELYSGIPSSFGLLEALSSYKAVRASYKKTIEALKTAVPSVVVLIDFPDFNFRVARAAKKMGIKVLYYVSPQVWAWRRGRVKTMGEISDRIAVILPFEEEIYRKEGVSCEFVGHPIEDEIGQLTGDREAVLRQLGIAAEGGPVVSVLPGSRPSELERLFPLSVDVVRALKKEFPECRFVVPLAPNVDFGAYASYIEALRAEGAAVGRSNALSAFLASDAAVIASGTSALQAAFLETPFVVLYKLSPLTYFLAKLILKVKYISLVNIIAGREIVPELIQGKASSENAVVHIKRILLDGAHREGMVSAFRDVKGMFGGKRASERVAEMAMELA